MALVLDKILKESPNTKDTCKGKIFRFNISQYTYDDRGSTIWGERKVMRQLKKKSCPGCEKCGWLDDDLCDFSNDNLVEIHPHEEHGALYQLMVVGISTDWETGLVDDYSLAFVKLENQDI